MSKNNEVKIAYPGMKYLMSIPRAAKEFGIGRDKLYELCEKDKTVPVIKDGQHKKINTGLFRQWLDEKALNGEVI